MAEKKEPKTTRTIRVIDFEAESMHEIANHSSSPGAEQLHKAADEHAALQDQTKVTIVEGPKRGDTVIFSAGHRTKVHSVFDALVWLAKSDGSMNDRPFPVGDLSPSGELNSWVYEGDEGVTP
jgi:hypothetical protein